MWGSLLHVMILVLLMFLQCYVLPIIFNDARLHLVIVYQTSYEFHLKRNRPEASPNVDLRLRRVIRSM